MAKEIHMPHKLNQKLPKGLTIFSKMLSNLPHGFPEKW